MRARLSRVGGIVAAAVLATGVLAAPAHAEPSQLDGTITSAATGAPVAGCANVYDLAYTWDDDHEVSWHLVEKGVMLTGMEGSYTLDEVDDGTRVTYQLAVNVSIPMLGMLKRKAEKVIIDTALKGLKRRVEATRG